MKFKVETYTWGKIIRGVPFAEFPEFAVVAEINGPLDSGKAPSIDYSFPASPRSKHFGKSQVLIIANTLRELIVEAQHVADELRGNSRKLVAPIKAKRQGRRLRRL